MTTIFTGVPTPMERGVQDTGRALPNTEGPSEKTSMSGPWWIPGSGDPRRAHRGPPH
jgi:hypothetical protein